MPGGKYTPEDLGRFLEAASADGDLSLLEIAWAVAAEEGPKSYSLQQMSQLLFDSTTPLTQYITYHMLLQDTVYFKVVNREGIAPQVGL